MGLYATLPGNLGASDGIPAPMQQLIPPWLATSAGYVGFTDVCPVPHGSFCHLPPSDVTPEGFMIEDSHAVPPWTSVVPLVNLPVCPVKMTINTTRTINPSTAMIMVDMLIPWPDSPPHPQGIAFGVLFEVFFLAILLCWSG